MNSGYTLWGTSFTTFPNNNGRIYPESFEMALRDYEQRQKKTIRKNKLEKLNELNNRQR